MTNSIIELTNIFSLGILNIVLVLFFLFMADLIVKT